ncbi:MAG: autotransporter outer membrane beta-barrel domain-containing protein, partial [Syntrophales bacterium]|nr:autotransporter outer membrane beta-barrel domain-containing protein [Syntrophales bacterium]
TQGWARSFHANQPPPSATTATTAAVTATPTAPVVATPAAPREPLAAMPASAPAPEIAPAQPAQPAPPAEQAEQKELAQIFQEKNTRSFPVRLRAQRKEAQDWRLSAGYRLWYVDMSSRYANSSLAGKGYLHGPTLGATWNRLTVQLAALFTLNDLDGDATGQYASGAAYTKKERFRRNDYDAVVKYRIDGPGRRFSVSPLLGFKYTRLSDMSAAYTNANGQQYTLTGHMDIWGPTLGLDVDIPIGNPETTPIFLALSGSGMYLRATGKHPGHWPAQGGGFGTAFEGADFSSWGWGGVADVHLRWVITDNLHLLAGGRLQSAELSDLSPTATTMRISNGFIGAYGNLNLVW